MSDGPLDSNLATVTLSITPVNDAPVVADVAMTTAEDTALVIAPAAYFRHRERQKWEGVRRCC